MIQIRITLSDEIHSGLELAAKRLGKKPATLARELFEQRMLELGMLKHRLS